MTRRITTLSSCPMVDCLHRVQRLRVPLECSLASTEFSSRPPCLFFFLSLTPSLSVHEALGSACLPHRPGHTRATSPRCTGGLPQQEAWRQGRAHTEERDGPFDGQSAPCTPSKSRRRIHEAIQGFRCELHFLAYATPSLKCLALRSRLLHGSKPYTHTHTHTESQRGYM